MAVLLLCSILIVFIVEITSFKRVPVNVRSLTTHPLASSLHHQSGSHHHHFINSNGKKVIVEFVAKAKQVEKRQESSSLRTLYREDQRGRQNVDLFVSKIANFIFNPTLLIASVYFFLFGVRKVTDFFYSIYYFVTGTKPRPAQLQGQTTATKVPTGPVVYQTYECNNCGMQMRPARGRAKVVLGNPRFRCARCGCKSDSYFDIDDMKDQRAVDRLKRLEEESNADYGDDEPTPTTNEDGDE